MRLNRDLFIYQKFYILRVSSGDIYENVLDDWGVRTTSRFVGYLGVCPHAPAKRPGTHASERGLSLSFSL